MTAKPGLCRTRSETPRTGFLIRRLICFADDYSFSSTDNVASRKKVYQPNKRPEIELAEYVSLIFVHLYLKSNSHGQKILASIFTRK